MNSPKCPRRRWDYTWEALSHIGTLRLFLFSPLFSPLTNCIRPTAALHRTHLGRWTVHLTWQEEIPPCSDSSELRPVSLRVPLPMVLVDPTAPVHCVAMDDHIHVKLHLLLPVDHPLVSYLVATPPAKWMTVFRRLFVWRTWLDLDVKDLLSLGEVEFYCKNCSAKLTTRPFRSFVEVPSVNWREAADNWFGACCCSFGGMSEKLARAYENSSTCEVDVCAVDASTVIIYMKNAAGFENSICKQQIMPSKSEDLEEGNMCQLTVTDSGIAQKPACQITLADIDDTAKMCECLNINGGKFNPKAEMTGADAKTYDLLTFCEGDSCENLVRNKMVDADCFLLDPELPEIDNYANFKCMIQLDQDLVAHTQKIPEVSHNSAAANVAPYDNVTHNCSHAFNTDKPLSASLESVSSLRNADHCCVSKSCEELGNNNFCGHNAEFINHEINFELHKKSGRFYNGSLGSGFVLRCSSGANVIEWVEVRCFQCSSIVGSYPSTRDQNVPVDGGLRLFKCHISTNKTSGNVNFHLRSVVSVDRKHTLQRLFSNLLLESAEDELSFHTVVRDVNTKIPMLQVILLNSEAWCSTDYLWDEENEDHEPELLPVLQPMVKVLFYDHTNSGESESRMIEQLTTRKQAEDVYMLTKEIEGLTKSLKSMQTRLPSSCSTLQGLSVSFMER